MTVAAGLMVELLHFSPESHRTQEMFSALYQTASAQGIDLTSTQRYQGHAPWLMLWGPGDPPRLRLLQQHVRAGGRAIVFDLAYWDRFRKLRVSFDAPHPQAWVMHTPLPASRFLADRVRVADVYHATGPIIIAGLGDKARVQYGADTVNAWEAAMAQQCKERWPDRPVYYRRKTPRAFVPLWASICPDIEIERVLTGASLVLTWHSNVAVDAIRLGIPVICRDGAAAAVCPETFGGEDPRPLPTLVRDQFLANLAHFQWSPSEAAQCWRFIQERLT